jgi:uncharacterized protein YecE (DUF72 family)
MGRVHIGTSGWHYMHWRGPYYPEKFPTATMLSFYMADFDSVEINNSFYRLPTVNALQTWHDTTPAAFCFAVKASRFLTHMKKLKDPEEGFRRFFPLVEILGDKLGPILFQLPPRWACNASRLEAFLSALPSEHRYTFELRDPSWHIPEVYALLEKYNAAFCIFELAGFQSPLHVTADFAYVRLHGPGKKYQGDYSRRTLSAWAKRIRAWAGHLSGVYVYFDNDQDGYAVKNAKELKRLVKD